MNAAGFSGATLCLGATAVSGVTLTGATGVLVVIVMSLLTSCHGYRVFSAKVSQEG